MKKHVLEKNIYYYTNMIDNPNKLIDAIEQTENQDYNNFISKWLSWRSYSGQPYHYGIEKTVYPVGIKKFDHNDKNNAQYIFETISNAFYRASKDYSLDLLDGKDPLLFLRFNIKKYKPGAHMGTHADQDDTSGRLKYSLVMYLNDNYEGGELSFTITDGKVIKPDPDYSIAKSNDLIAIKPQAGSVVIFPSYSPYHHTAHIVKDGNKYMIPTFCMY
jgi:hypothetical protein